MSTRIYVLFLIIFGLLLYSNSLLNGFIGDDFEQIVFNEKVHSIKNVPYFFTGSTYVNDATDRLGGLYYRPFMMSVFSGIYSLFKSDPLPYHFLQIILHLSNSILLLLVSRRFFKEKIAFFIALLFLVHPINSEVVNYIANLQETLFFFFGMVSFYLVMHKKFVFSAIFLLLSLISKESGILFAAVSILYLFLFNKNQLKKYVLYAFISCAIFFYLRFFIAHMYSTQVPIAPIASASLIDRILTIPPIFVYYVKTFLFPFTLVTFQFWTKNSFDPTVSLLTFSLMTSFLILLIIGLGILKKKLDRKTYVFFAGWFLLGILLHLQIVPLDMTVADRWFYFPIVGLLGVGGILFFQFSKQVKIISISVTVILTLFSFITFTRNFDWRDNFTLYSRDLSRDKNNFYLLNGVASEFIKEKKYIEAKPFIEQSVGIYPYVANVNNMAIIYYEEKNYKKTKELLQKAITLGSSHTLYENYSNFLLHHDSTQSAAIFTKDALIKYPNSNILKSNLKKVTK